MRRRSSKKIKSDIGINNNYKNSIIKYQNRVYKNNNKKLYMTPENFNILMYNQGVKILSTIVAILILILLILLFIYLNK